MVAFSHPVAGDLSNFASVTCVSIPKCLCLDIFLGVVNL